MENKMEYKLITAMGMMAENMQRQALGESMAYVESDFRALLSDQYNVEEIPQMAGTLDKLNTITLIK